MDNIRHAGIIGSLTFLDYICKIKGECLKSLSLNQVDASHCGLDPQSHKKEHLIHRRLRVKPAMRSIDLVQ